MEKIIDKMRSDFEVVAAARREAGEWSEQDVCDANAAIKAAIKGNDTVTIGLWARWLADLAAGVVFFRLVVVPADSRVRNAIADAKSGAAK